MERHERIAFTLVEVLICAGIMVVVLVVALDLFSAGGRTSARLTSRMGAQQTGRKAIVRLLKEIQEGMEVALPRPGMTLSYAVVRDRVSLPRWYFVRPDHTSSIAGQTLWVLARDPKSGAELPPEQLLTGIKRLTFTCRSEGALQVNLVTEEGGQEYGILTTIRLRNLASAEEVW